MTRYALRIECKASHWLIVNADSENEARRKVEYPFNFDPPNNAAVEWFQENGDFAIEECCLELCEVEEGEHGMELYNNGPLLALHNARSKGTADPDGYLLPQELQDWLYDLAEGYYENQESAEEADGFRYLTLDYDGRD